MALVKRFATLCLLGAVYFSGGSGAAQVSDGTLSLEPVDAIPCADRDTFQQGQQVRLQGDGFASGAPVSLEFSSDPFAADLGPTAADGTGTIDVVVTIPQGFSAPTFALVEAIGPAPIGSRALDKLIRIVPPGAGDGDGDGIADPCDNCPSDPNASQTDTDQDGVGDSCDGCPADSANDPDGDGLCSDTDPCPFDPDNDIDGDQVCGDVDNCPTLSNDQVDLDMNGIGDACQTDTTCSDGIDNDEDGFTDFPEDAGCASASDTTETDPSLPCDDGLDNDSDAKIDFRSDGLGDPGCGSSSSPSEDPACDDESDNDTDGAVDWDGDHGLFDADPECEGLGHHDSELVPEPSVALGVAAGIAFLGYLSSQRRTRRR